MTFSDVEASAALQALSPRVQKLLNPTKPGNPKGSRGRSHRHRNLQKTAVLAVQEDPVTLALRYRNDAAKHRNFFNSEGPALGRISPGPCESFPTSPRMRRSPSPYESAPQGVGFWSASPWQVAPPSKQAATADGIHLPQVNNNRGIYGTQAGERSNLSKTGAGNDLKLPAIKGAAGVDGGAAHAEVQNANGTRSKNRAPITPGEHSETYHPMKQSRTAIRQEFATASTAEEVAELRKRAEAALQSDRHHRGGKDHRSLLDVAQEDCRLVTSVRELLTTHLPRATDDVRRASMVGLVQSEASRRLRVLNEATETATPPPPQLKARPARPPQIRTASTSPEKANAAPEPQPTPRSPTSPVRTRTGPIITAPKAAPQVAAEKQNEKTNVPDAVGSHRAEGGGSKPKTLAPTQHQATDAPLVNSKDRLHSKGSSMERSQCRSPQAKERSRSKQRHGTIGHSHSREPSKERVPTLERINSKEQISSPERAPPKERPNSKDSKSSKDKTSSKHSAKVNRREMEAIFKKFMDDGQVHHDDMFAALEMLGFVPQQVWIDEAFAKVTKYTTLRVDQFLKFVDAYVVRQKEAYAEAFNACDEDQSGNIEIDELAKLLPMFGMEPMRQVLMEVISEVDEDGSGVLDLTEFYEVMDIIRGREGFPRRDYDLLMGAFRRYDVDHSGEIGTMEFVSLLTYLGIGSNPKLTAALIGDVDEDKTNSMSEKEFLVCMRKVRDRELARVRQIMEDADTDNSGTLSGSELRVVLQGLGYYPCPVAIRDAATEAGLDPWDEDIDLNELWQLVQVYRLREGFNNEDMKEMEETFSKYSSLGFLCVQDLDLALRNMGYLLNFEHQRVLTYQVDIAMTGQLDLPAFRKLVRMCREREISEVEELFESLDESSKGLMSLADAVQLLKDFHYVDVSGNPPMHRDVKDEVHGIRGDCADIDVYEYVSMTFTNQWLRRQFFRDHAGFSPAETEAYKTSFSEVDSDNSGELQGAEMIGLLDQCFPEMSSNKMMRGQLVQIIKEIDLDGSGSFDFFDYLRLMRKCGELQLTARFEKERRAVDETAFSPPEVAEFRQLFIASDVDGDMELSVNEFKKMIASICPMGEKNSKAMSTVFFSVAAQQEHVEGRQDHCDFPEFLTLWHQLLEINFAGIREKTGMGKNMGAQKPASSPEHLT